MRRLENRIVVLAIFIMAAMVFGLTAQYIPVQAKTNLVKNTEQYLNNPKVYLYLGGKDTVKLTVKDKLKEQGAAIYWYVNTEKGVPEAVKVDNKTGTIKAVKAGTAYIICRITDKGGKAVSAEASVTVRNNITKVGISSLPSDNTVKTGYYTDFHYTVLNTAGGKGKKTQGVTRWEIAKDTAGVGSISEKGRVFPVKAGSFQVRAVSFQSDTKYNLWLKDKEKYKNYITAASAWVTIKVESGRSTAATQDELERFLSGGAKEFTISTDKDMKFVIPKGNYTDTTLYVNAANSDVKNYGQFKKVIIQAIKDHTWIELADGNIIYLKDDIASVTIDSNVTVKRIVIDRSDALLNLNVMGTVEQVQVLYPSTLTLSGNSNLIPVTVEDTAKGSKITSSVPLNLSLNSDAEVKLEKGAETSSIDKKSEFVVASVENKTSSTVVITTDSKGGMNVAAGETGISGSASSQINPSGGQQIQYIPITALGNITGDYQAGKELKAGAVTPENADIAYQWMIGDTASGTFQEIAGAVTGTYTPSDNDAGKYIKVKVTGKNVYTGILLSPATDRIEASDSKLLEEAGIAVKAYEDAPITISAEITAAKQLQTVAETAVSSVKDPLQKSQLEQRILTKSLTVTKAEKQITAEEAVRVYETAPLTTLAEIAKAENLKTSAEDAVREVSDLLVQTGLLQRIEDRSLKIAEARKEAEGEKAVSELEAASLSTKDEILAAESLKETVTLTVTGIGNDTVKTALLQRIAAKAAAITEAKAELLAEEAVHAYEAAILVSPADIEAAKDLRDTAVAAINLVANAEIKSKLMDRVTKNDTRITEAESEFSAEEAVALYEAAPISNLSEITLSEAKRTDAENKANAVVDETIRAGFLQRITARAAIIAETKAQLSAEAAVKLYETVPIDSLMNIMLSNGVKAAAEDAIGYVNEISVKTQLEQRVIARAAVIATAKAELEAQAAVTKAETSYSQEDADTAQALINLLNLGATKIGLQNRLNVVVKVIQAETAIEKAEASKLQTDVDAAGSLVNVLPESTKKAELVSRLNTVQAFIDQQAAIAENNAAIASAGTKLAQTVFTAGQTEADTQAKAQGKVEALISALGLEGITVTVTGTSYMAPVPGSEGNTNGTNGSFTFKVTLTKGDGDRRVTDTTDVLTMNITAAVYVPPEIINSLTISNFNFATINSSTASLVSKTMTTSDFSGSNSKSFTITDGAGNVIPIALNWNITSDQGFSTAALVGSAIESFLQDYFYKKGGADALMNRTLWCASFSGDTFTLSTFYEGLQNRITISGNDASYFFNTLTAQGTDLDTSANRSFSVSDGIHTANITLNTDVATMDGLVSKINAALAANAVQATAVKTGDNTFKLVGYDITVGGTDKDKLFSTFVSQ